jgi:hypothetical protein
LASDPGAQYSTVIEIDAVGVRPMLALPGDPGNGMRIEDAAGPIRVDIAYAGSCTAGKKEDMDMYARVLREAAERGAHVAPWVRFYIQCGSQDVKQYCEEQGYLDLFQEVGATFLEPSCGACINAGPGVSKTREEVTISAINRNFPGRSGPGQLYLGNPYTVAASAIAVEEHGVGVAAGAPFRRLRADGVLHVLDRLAVPLVVERREVVGRRVPLVVDVLVTAAARGARHEEVRRDDAADVRLRRGRKEGTLRNAAFRVHGRGRHQRILNAMPGLPAPFDGRTRHCSQKNHAEDR